MLIVYCCSNCSFASRQFPYSRCVKSPLNPTLSHLPYQGSMQTNGAFFFAGDQIPKSGAVELTVKYAFPAKEYTLSCRLPTILISRSPFPSHNTLSIILGFYIPAMLLANFKLCFSLISSIINRCLLAHLDSQKLEIRKFR